MSCALRSRVSPASSSPRSPPTRPAAICSNSRHASIATIARATSTAAEIYKAEFYRQLLTGANNDILTEALRGIHARIAIFRRFAFIDEARVEPSIKELETIIDAAARDRDPKAAWAACEHHILLAGDLAIFEYAKRNRELATAS